MKSCKFTVHKVYELMLFKNLLLKLNWWSGEFINTECNHPYVILSNNNIICTGSLSKYEGCPYTEIDLKEFQRLVLLKEKEQKHQTKIAITWQEALKFYADGTNIEVTGCCDGWQDISVFRISSLQKSETRFRIKLDTITVESGVYTKQQLLNLAETIND